MLCGASASRLTCVNWSNLNKDIGDFSVVVPVYNEQDNIEPLVAEIHSALEGVVEFEVIFVDDGSMDGTPGVLYRLKAAYPRLKTVRHSSRCGQSAALVTGVAGARYRCVVTMDGDGQNDPHDIPKVLALASEAQRVARPWLITGIRRRRDDSWLRRLSSRLANSVRKRLLRDGIPDTGCGLKAFRREDFLALPYFDHMHRFLPALFLRAGGNVLQSDVKHRPRVHGRSKYGLHNRLWVGVLDLLGVMWLQRRMTLPVIEKDPGHEC